MCRRYQLCPHLLTQEICVHSMASLYKRAIPMLKCFRLSLVGSRRLCLAYFPHLSNSTPLSHLRHPSVVLLYLPPLLLYRFCNRTIFVNIFHIGITNTSIQSGHQRRVPWTFWRLQRMLQSTFPSLYEGLMCQLVPCKEWILQGCCWSTAPTYPL